VWCLAEIAVAVLCDVKYISADGECRIFIGAVVAVGESGDDVVIDISFTEPVKLAIHAFLDTYNVCPQSTQYICEELVPMRPRIVAVVSIRVA
jgi:hypothetical protein